MNSLKRREGMRSGAGWKAVNGVLKEGMIQATGEDGFTMTIRYDGETTFLQVVCSNLVYSGKMAGVDRTVGAAILVVGNGSEMPS